MRVYKDQSSFVIPLDGEWVLVQYENDYEWYLTKYDVKYQKRLSGSR